MTISSYKVGPGTLKLGTGGTKDVSAQLTSCQVNPSEETDSEDAVPVLSGEELAGEDNFSYTFTLSGTFLQDLASTGVVAYSWDNMGSIVDFEFIPVTASARAVTGQVRIVPLNIGGDVKQRATADFEWSCIGTPDFDAA